jgi:hypothetical protein
VDRDGVLDLLTESNTGHFGVWHGAGDGTFTLLHDYAISGYSTDLRAGDINSDGEVDVMISSFSGIQIYLGQGSGAFGTPQTIATGIEPMACELGDWNRDGSLDLAVACNNYAGQAYLSVHEQVTPPPFTGFCFGDGTGLACPCSNSGSSGQGCANSTGVGAVLSASGARALSADTLQLSAANIPGPGLFFQGTARFGGGAGITFGDGLLCAGGTITRMGVVFPTGTTASYPGGSTPNPIHVAGAPIVAGDVRHYQCWYRDAASFCSSATFNLTQGLTLTWRP